MISKASWEKSGAADQTGVAMTREQNRRLELRGWVVRLTLGVFGTCIAALLASGASADIQPKHLMDMQTFRRACDERTAHGTRTDLCRGYIAGIMDSVVSLAEGRQFRVSATPKSQIPFSWTG